MRGELPLPAMRTLRSIPIFCRSTIGLWVCLPLVVAWPTFVTSRGFEVPALDRRWTFFPRLLLFVDEVTVGQTEHSANLVC
ncbi:hypothetical protein BJX66DRAFT_212255 [Aspergillus keveii]|uniref:Secreted protein n=1 Tax=Aspergillus keveii TaxID=714993 RepID=A0ABR4GLZ1_9EURO